MIIIICIILLFIINLFFLKIFSVIASALTKGKGMNIEKKKCNKKKNLFSKIKSFLYCYYQLNMLFFGNIPSYSLRYLFYKHICNMQIGKNTKIRMNVEILCPWNVKIGDNCFIGKNCILDGRFGITIEDNVNMSDYSAIWTMQHDTDDPDFGCEGQCGNVVIGKRVWLCFRSIIMPKVKIGEGAVIAAAAVATKDCDEFGVYAGIPAKKIKERNRNINYNLDISSMHFV